MVESTLSPKVSSLSIGVLQLGIKVRKLRESGIETIGDLSGLLPIAYPNPYGLGPGSIRKLTENYSSLQHQSMIMDVLYGNIMPMRLVLPWFRQPHLQVVPTGFWLPYLKC